MCVGKSLSIRRHPQNYIHIHRSVCGWLIVNALLFHSSFIISLSAYGTLVISLKAANVALKICEYICTLFFVHIF